ncbi:hypothetical protein FRC12_020954 [Ceratobasidium sp. 428]|nr:hypothetical protein FRC12_020954 [Ceratobasidium sp. 428]
MEVIKNLLEARLVLEKAAADFLDVCATLKLLAVPSLASAPGQLAFESNMDNILSSVDSASLVIDLTFKSRNILQKLLNLPTTRAPINKLPAETLSYIFAIIVASSPCNRVGTERETLLDIPQVCTKWNQVSASSPALWSHVDVRPSSFSTITIAFRHVQMQLKRCRNVPVHLHLDDSLTRTPQDRGLDVVALIQSHGEPLGSLIVTSVGSDSWVYMFLGSMLSHPVSSSLKTLFIHGVQGIYSRGTYGQLPAGPLPVTFLCGLAVLDLYDVGSSTYPTVEGIIELLPSCSTLHTLRLRRLKISPDSLQSYQIIPFPRLRFLEISAVNCAGALSLLSKLVPGGLELDVRLDADYIRGDAFDSPGQLLLARSNVVSLSINDPARNSVRPPLTCFASVPRLRMLQLDSIRLAQDLNLALETTIDDQTSLQVPCLQSLCLIGLDISSQAIALIEDIIRQRKLRHLAFLDCFYPPERTRSIDGDQENCSISDYDSDADVDKYEGEMPRSMRDWFSERVGGSVVVGQEHDNRIFHGVDPFVQNLIRLE